jgi:hypothetical protein
MLTKKIAHIGIYEYPRYSNVNSQKPSEDKIICSQTNGNLLSIADKEKANQQLLTDRVYTNAYLTGQNVPELGSVESSNLAHMDPSIVSTRLNSQDKINYDFAKLNVDQNDPKNFKEIRSIVNGKEYIQYVDPNTGTVKSSFTPQGIPVSTFNEGVSNSNALGRMNYGITVDNIKQQNTQDNKDTVFAQQKVGGGGVPVQMTGDPKIDKKISEFGGHAINGVYYIPKSLYSDFIKVFPQKKGKK